MEFKQGTHVYTDDGKDVGTIDRVVLDPKTKDITHIVVEKGFLFTEDKIVPVNLIASATEERITLRHGVGSLEKLPPFEETHYVPLSEAEEREARYPVGLASPLYWYPPMGGWIGYTDYNFGYAYPPPYPTETERNTPPGTVSLEEGARVISSDDKHVGHVDQVLTEPNADQAAYFVISRGLLFKERKLVPVTWVKHLDEDEVHLSVTADTLQALREYEEA